MGFLEGKNETTVAWIVLLLGGVFQIGWSIGVDFTERFTIWYWDLITIFFLALSMVCMEWPMRHGVAFTTAYAVWIGVGVSLTVIVSEILGLDDLNWVMVLFMAIVLAGVVGLKATPVEYMDDKPKENEDAKERCRSSAAGPVRMDGTLPLCPSVRSSLPWLAGLTF